MLFIHGNNIKISSHGLKYNLTIHLGTAHKTTINMLFTHAITQHHTNHASSLWTVQNHSRDFFTRFKSFGTETTAIQASTIPHPLHGPYPKSKTRRRKTPTFPEFVETPQNWYPRVVLSVGSNFASFLAGNRQSDRQKF